MQVLPPANGKKMWRVKRTVSSGSGSSSETDSSLECLNNSLKISAAGKQAMTKRSPMKKRPKSKPGMPKDFVFVDLSPIKSDEADSDASSTISSPNMVFSPNGPNSQSPMSQTNDSFSVYGSEDELSQCGLSAYDNQYNMFGDSTFGLGLMNINYGYEQAPAFDSYSIPQQTSYPEIAYQDTAYQSSFGAQHAYTEDSYFPPVEAKPSHKRSKSTTSIPRRKSAGGFQFKTYKGPNCVKKPSEKRLRRTQSQPTQEILSCLDKMSSQESTQTNASEFQTPPLQCTATPAFPQNEFDAFMHMPKADHEPLNLAYEQVDDLAELDTLDSLLQPINLDFFPASPVKNYKDDFDFSNFVAI